MDTDLFKLFKSGMTEEDKEIIAKEQAVESLFKKEQGKVVATMNTRGFKVIMDKVVSDMEVAKHKLLTCKESDLKKIQLEIKIIRYGITKNHSF